MEDIVFDESTKQFSKIVFEGAKFLINTIWAKATEKDKEIENFLHKTSKKYMTRFYNRFGHIQILGMNNPMPLSALFVDIWLLDSIQSRKYLSIEELKNTFKNSKSAIRTFQHLSDKIDGMSIAKTNNRLIVLGAPGSGKSTYLKKIGLECFSYDKENNLNKYIPILIELKNIDDKNTIRNLMINELEIAGFPDPDTFLSSYLISGNLILLFDGLDEIPLDQEDSTFKDIANFCDRYSENKFIISSRTAAYKGGLKKFQIIEIANLDKPQIYDFIKKWFKEKSRENNIYLDVSEECWQKIQDTGFESTIELAQSPLLLTLLCLVYSYQQDFPRNKALLYRDAINVLLKEWNAEKRVHKEIIYKDLTLPFEELLLSHIAHYYFTQDDYFFDRSKLCEDISDYISNNLNAPKYLDGGLILDAISIQQGILVERAKNIFSFSHLTFQEYFTAKYIDDYSLIDYYIDTYLPIAKWREVFVLYSGIAKVGSDKLLESIYISSINFVISNERIRRFMSYVDSEGNKDLNTRLLNVLILLLFGTRYNNLSQIVQIIKEVDSYIYDKIYQFSDDTFKHNLLNYDNILNLRDYKSDIIFAARDSLLSSQERNVISYTFCKKLNFHWLDADGSFSNAIYKYLDLILFLYQCKKSSILVSKNVWNKIEDGLFRYTDLS